MISIVVLHGYFHWSLNMQEYVVEGEIETQLLKTTAILNSLGGHNAHNLAKRLLNHLIVFLHSSIQFSPLCLKPPMVNITKLKDSISSNLPPSHSKNLADLSSFVHFLVILHLF